MKKTTRSSTFETNSSSTHVYSFSNLVKGRCDLTVIPDNNNEVVAQIENYFNLDSTVHPLYKTRLLLALAKYLFDTAKVDQVKKVFEDFTGAKLVIKGLNEIKGPDTKMLAKCGSEEEKTEAYEECFRDTFSGLDNEYTSASDHIASAKEYLLDDENIKCFIFCSKNSLGEEITYD